MSERPGHFVGKYDANAFDENLVLKVPVFLWVIIAYSVHPIVFVGLGAIPRAGSNYGFLQEYVGLGAALWALPTFVLLVALVRRTPDASPVLRRIWHSGRWFLIASLLLQSWAPFSYLTGGTYRASGSLPQQEMMLALHGVMIGILLFHQRTIDTFNDYPGTTPN